MRYIGAIADQKLAQRFSDHLLTNGIESSVEESAKGGYAIWVHHDDHLERAGAELKAFEAAPEDPKFAVESAASKLRKEKLAEQARLQRNYRDVRTQWARKSAAGTPLTIILVLLCGAVAGVNFTLDRDRQSGRAGAGLMSADGEPAAHYIGFHGGESRYNLAFADRFTPILSGQVWRIVTPIFLHLGVLHFAFNMFWLWDFGRMIESRKGTTKLLAMVLGIAAISNVLQAVIVGVNFGGMSGVVYGLFGYIWLKGKYQSYDGIGISSEQATIMFFWLILCFTPIVPNVANAAHVGGFLVGAGIVWIPYQYKKLARKR